MHAHVLLEALGQLARHADLPDSTAGEAALYATFSARADLMGWSTTLGRSSSPDLPGPPERPVLWWMHEAELTAGAGTPRIGFVQVGLETGVEPAMAMPPLVQCFDDALHRFGEVELSGLQVTCRYLQPHKGSSAWDLLSGLSWFSTARGARPNALIAFDNGFLGGLAESEFVASIRGMGAGFFEFGPRMPAPPETVVDTTLGQYLEKPLTPAAWGVPVTLPEWSASSAAWALATVIDVARSGGPGPRNFAVRLTRVQ